MGKHFSIAFIYSLSNYLKNITISFLTMEEVLENWRKLSLTESEGAKVSLKKAKNLLAKDHVLAAKFLTKRALNVEAIGRTFKPLWRSNGEFTIREVEDHVLLFVFEHENDAERVLTSKPWVFDKHLVFKWFDFSVHTRNMRFTTTKFWVQLHGLPMNMMIPDTAIEIGETIGQVSVTKNAKEMVGGTFLCVRVEVDISKPLCRGRKVGIIEDSEIWVAFKYEKLPNFCYWCGMVSHTDKDCDVWIGSKGKLRHEQQGYGNWLRALPFNPGDGLGRTQNNDSGSVVHIQQDTVVNQAINPLGGRANVDKALNLDQGLEEELQTCPYPEVNAINKGSNVQLNANCNAQRSQSNPTKFGMQFNGIDSDMNEKGNGDNVQVINSKSLITPRRSEFIGDYEEELNENQNSNTNRVQLSEFHATRKWKRIEHEPHVHSQPPSSHDPPEKKRARKDEEADLPELQNKKILVSKAEV